MKLDEPCEPAPAETQHVNFWIRFARRWSGRGRIRSVFIALALIFSTANFWSAVAGGVVFALGLLLHVISKGNLIRNMQLCTGGPYAWVRHPFYVGNFLVDAGLCLLAGVPILAACYAVAFPLAYLPRIFAEEEALKLRFGQQFLDYAGRTPALMPRSFPRLIAWLKGIRFESLRVENELSRMLRLMAYPFCIAGVVLGKLRYQGEHVDLELIIAAGLTACAFWAAAEIIHRHTEDGKSTRRFRFLRFCWVFWVAVPVMFAIWFSSLDSLSGGFKSAQQRVLFIAGLILIFIAKLLRLFPFREYRFKRGLIQPIFAFGMALACDQIIVAPVLAWLVWLGWYFKDEPAELAEAEKV